MRFRCDLLNVALDSSRDLDLSGIDWVIVGGESGPAARHPAPMPDKQERATFAEPFFQSFRQLFCNDKPLV